MRQGSEFARLGWIVEMRLRARRRVRNLGESGKLPSVWMSLSVRSMQSHGCSDPVSTIPKCMVLITNPKFKPPPIARRE